MMKIMFRYGCGSGHQDGGIPYKGLGIGYGDGIQITRDME